MSNKLVLLVFTACLWLGTGYAADLRPLTTDRPSKTESPVTVDKGLLQLESDITALSLADESEDYKLSLFPFNIKYGISHASDIEVIFQTFQIYRSSGTISRGHGDTTIRYKYFLKGHKGEPFAVALLPYVKLPTAQENLGNNAIEMGIKVPLSIPLIFGFKFGAMAQFDYNRSTALDSRHAEVASSVKLSHGLIFEGLNVYGEFWNRYSSESGTPWAATADLGLTLLTSANIQLDAGVNIGLTRKMADYEAFVGFSTKW